MLKKCYYLILLVFPPLMSLSQDAYKHEGIVAMEVIKKKSMLNYYLVDDYVYSNKGFYLVLNGTIQYEIGFFCLSTLSVRDSNGIIEGLPYQIKFFNFENSINSEEKEIYFDYSGANNKNRLLKKINSKKFRNTNYPILYAFDQSYIDIKGLGVCYIPFQAKITAVAMEEYNFKRYVFDGKNIKLKEIKFYYISELEIEGHKIR